MHVYLCVPTQTCVGSAKWPFSVFRWALFLIWPFAIFYLRQGDYVFSSIWLVCLSVCLFDSNITQKVVNRMQCNFIEGSRMVKLK